MVSRALLMLLPGAAASLSFSSLFEGGAVLQRGQEAAVFGHSSSQVVTIFLDNVKVATASVRAGGNWTAYLPAQSAAFKRQLAASDGHAKITVTVSFGDVILCSGQSNMGMPVGPITDKRHPGGTGFHALNGTAESAAADRYTDKIFVISPQRHEGWKRSAQGEVLYWNSVTSQNLYQMSAICWYTGKSHFEHLEGKIPVGLMVGAVGGSPIERWIKKSNIATCQVDIPVCDNKPGFHKAHEGSFFHMFIEVLQPYTVGAVVWDQGERDTHCINPAIPDRTETYACLEQQLIQDWRDGFNSSFAFVTVQLPGYLGDCDPKGTNYSSCVPGVFNMRIAQDAGARKEANTGVVVTYDQSCDYGIKTNKCPFGTVHTLDKVAVGERVARQLRKLMLKEDVISEGPRATSVEAVFAHKRFLMTVEFDAKGALSMKGTANCKMCCASTDFDVSADGHLWVNATDVKASGSTLTFTAALSARPTRVRYTANQAFPQCAVYDETSLPALPFILPVLKLDDAIVV